MNHLTVSWNVVFDTGEPVFIEGTEVAIPSYNLVAMVRPIWSFIGGPVAGVLLDREPRWRRAATWRRVALRVLVPPAREARRHLGPVRGGGEAVSDIYTFGAHGGQRRAFDAGLKVSDYFPTVGVPPNTFGRPATFRDFLGWNNGRFGVWDEFRRRPSAAGC